MRTAGAIQATVSDALAPFALRGQLLWLATRSPCPRQEFVQAIVRPEIDEAGEHVGELGLGVDAVEFAGLDQRSEDSPVFGAVVMAGEEGILSGQRLGTHGTFDDVGVELDAAVVEEADEPVPMVEAVADGIGNRRSSRDACEVLSRKALNALASGADSVCRTICLRSAPRL